MEMIMVPYRYQNKKAFLVARISLHRHTVCALDILAELLTQTSARSGSTKTGPFHGLRQRLVHAVNPPHYEEKAGNEHTALLQVG
jgi:hypothetical protein